MDRSKKYREAHPERVKAAQKRWRENNREYLLRKKRERYQENAQRLRDQRKLYREREEEKERARWTLANAVRRGEVLRGSCEIGEDCLGRIEAHHDDYSQPLEVRWLCQRHHSLHHYASAD